jgi:hypothetical protein
LCVTGVRCFQDELEVAILLDKGLHRHVCTAWAGKRTTVQFNVHFAGLASGARLTSVIGDLDGSIRAHSWSDEMGLA